MPKPSPRAVSALVLGPIHPSGWKVLSANFAMDEVLERALTARLCRVCKAWAMAVAREDEVSESIPASMLRSHPNAVLFLDEAAASDLGHGVTG
jgi:hypothetical protein